MSIFERFTRKNPEDNPVKQREQQVAKLTPQLLANAKENQEEYPEDAEAIGVFVSLLRSELKQYGRGQGGAQEGTQEADYSLDATAKFYFTEDRMDAYACLIPPINGGKELNEEILWEDMRYEGISHGILEESAKTYLARKRYLHVFPIARGSVPVDGEDGVVTDCYERKAAIQLEVEPGTAVDFGSSSLMQIVRKGEIICRIQPPTSGENGMDVTGHTLPCRKGVACEAPAGENTRLSKDGLLLLADLDGVVFMEGGNFCVKQQRIIPGDVDLESGALRVEGDIYIQGNVEAGAVVEATGNIIIGGEVIDARVQSSAGSIRVQKGIQGKKGTVVKAERQVQAPVIEGASVKAGGDVFAEVIANSRVTSSTVSALGGRGLILGGQVRAQHQVQCKRIGNQSNQRNQITVGGFPGLTSELEKNKKELEEVKGTLEKLRKSIMALRSAGDLLSLEKRAVLTQLTEQRTLYEDRENALNGKVKELKQTLHAATAGRVICQELFPVTAIQIGTYEMEFKNTETKCNIHVYAGQIVTK